MRTRLRTLRRAAKQTREDSMRQRIVRTRCGCDQRRAVPFGEILQQSERVGTYPEHRDKAFRWTGCWSEGDSNPRCREGLYGRNWARVWRTIRPEKKHPCWRESVRLGFGSVWALSGACAGVVAVDEPKRLSRRGTRLLLASVDSGYSVPANSWTTRCGEMRYRLAPCTAASVESRSFGCLSRDSGYEQARYGTLSRKGR